MLFSEKENLLSLYNALNGTAYTDMDNLEITTLENAVYMNYKNDISFVFDYELLLYEHQSAVNPNMPLKESAFPEAVERAVEYCIKNGILSEFLSKNRAEVITVSILEYDEEKHIKSEREEWREIGRSEGMDNLSVLLKSLMDSGKTEELQRVLSDSEYREKLYREFFKK